MRSSNLIFLLPLVLIPNLSRITLNLLNNKSILCIVITGSRHFSFGLGWGLPHSVVVVSVLISVVDSHELAEVSARISFRPYNHFTSPIPAAALPES